MRRSLLTSLLVLAPLALSACDSGGYLLADEEGGVIVEPGKEDNFLSTAAQEYMIEGRTTVTIEDDLADATEEVKLARVKELIPLKQVVIAWFLNAYVADKEHDGANAAYGGFSGMTKNGSWEELGITALDATTYEFTFRQEMAGKMDMLTAMPTTKGDDGRLYFDLIVGRIDNDDMAQLETNSEWYRSSPWSEFDPSKVDASRLETMKVAVWAEPRSIDSWIDYNRLFADGVVSIGIHWGWDYHKEYHLVHSEEVYNWLVGPQGFKSPVASYAEYTRTSGPLTRTITANGKSVEVRISLYWGKPGTDADPDTDAGGRVLEDDMRASFKDREIIVFAGHSGPFYGFALANWRKTSEGDLDDSEVPSLDMPSDTYQIVFAEGCDTYGLGEAFRLNPAKAGAKNIDIITTTSFSNASTADGTKDFLTAVFGASRTSHAPQTWGDILTGLEGNSYWFKTMYGVHGLDDNPHRHPYANLTRLCGKCSVNADCGGEGNRCSKLPNGGASVCSFLCTADDGCPDGYKCMAVANGSYIKTNQCVPANLTCSTAPVVTGPVAILNEVLAAPGKADEDGDANGDGKVGASADEFVEIVNTSGAELDLSGWMVADSWMTRVTFPAGTKLAAGKSLVVFGGGDPAKFGSLGGSIVRTAGWAGLGLNNGGDTVYLRDAKKKVVDKVTYGNEAVKAYSIVRKTDGDPAAPFVVHPGVHHSAGLKQDGSPF